MSGRSRGATAVAVLCGAWLATEPAPAAAQDCLPGGCSGDILAGLCGLDLPFCEDGGSENPPTCEVRGCNFVYNCNTPSVGTDPISRVQRTGLCTSEAQLGIEVTVPWNRWAREVSPNGTVDVVWFDRGTVPDCDESGFRLALCEYLQSDDFETYVIRRGLTCAGAPYDFGEYSAQVRNCQQPCPCGFPGGDHCICGVTSWVNREGLAFEVTRDDLGCLDDPAEPVPMCPERPPGFDPVDPMLASGALCRGACGADCPDECLALPDEQECLDYVNDCELPGHVDCEYDGLLDCGTHDGCRRHDDCYDDCAGDPRPRTCRRACDLLCIDEYGFNRCTRWARGLGPYDGRLQFAPPGQPSAPLPGVCPPE